MNLKPNAFQALAHHGHTNRFFQTYPCLCRVGSIIVALPGFAYYQLSAYGTRALFHASLPVLLQLCLTGVLSTIAQLTKTSGLQMSNNFGVLVMRYLDIFFAFIWDLVFLHAEIGALSVCGALIIVGGCLASILLKRG